MQRNRRRILILFCFIVSFLGLRFAAATACVLLPLPTVLDEYEWANVVITARVVSIEKTTEPDPIHFNIRSATMVVQKVFKGNVKVQDAISFAQGNGIDCLWQFDEKMIDPQKSKLLTSLTVNLKHGESMRRLKIFVPTTAHSKALPKPKSAW